MKIEKLYLFMDNILRLNQAFEIEYLDLVRQIDEESHMQLTTTAERHGFQQGMQKGIHQGMEQGMQQGMQQGIYHGMQQGERAILLRQLTAKFGTLPMDYEQKIQMAEGPALDALGIKLLHAHSLSELFD